MTSNDHLLITMLASKASAGLARTLTQVRLSKWDYLHISDTAFLIVSELVANATDATPHGEIKFRLSRDAMGILIAVWDSSERLPQAKPVEELTLETLDLSEEHWDDNGAGGCPSSRPWPPSAATPRISPAANGSGPASSHTDPWQARPSPAP